MREPTSPLSCYQCATPAAPDDAACRECGFPLDWGAIADLRSMDYTQRRVEQWRRDGVIHPALAGRLLAELAHNRETLLDVLFGRERRAAREPEPEPAPVAEPAAVEPAAPAPPPIAEPLAVPGAMPSLGGAPVRQAEAPAAEGAPAAGSPSRPARRPLLEVLLDLGTVRLLLYTGALMLAVGTMIWLRDALRVQLQRPVVQASLLGLATFAALAGGVALVVRARERDEQRLIGRGVLFLGTLLLPLNPWFWLRTGLIEDRGNAWIVGAVSFALSLAIAFGLGDRVFLYMSYAAALLTSWLLTFKVTGGAAPGAYALALTLVSGAYLHAELPVASRGREKWEKLGPALFLCGHIGVALTLLFYTNAVRLLPPELFAAFRHFDASGYTPWVGVAVSLLAAEAYLYSARRRRDARYTYVGVAAALWAAALSLLASDAPRGAWLFACGTAALASWGLGTALAREPLWGPPLRAASRALAWVGFGAALVAAAAYALGGVEPRWFTAAGAVFLAAAFALDATSRDRAREAFPAALLALMLAAYALRRAGLPWVYAGAVVALLAACVPFAAARLLRAREGARTGARYASTFATLVLAVAGAYFAVAESLGERFLRPLPLALALAVALGAHAWHSVTPAVRYPAYALAALFLQLAAAFAAFDAEARFGLADRQRAFLFVPFSYALLGGWLALRRAGSERVREIARVVRAAAMLSVLLAAGAALPLLLDGLFSTLAGFVFALALALAAAVPLATAAAGGEGDASYAEGAVGVVLALGAFLGLSAGIAGRVAGYEAAVFLPLVGLAPALLAAAGRFASRAPAIASPASIVGDAVAALLVAGLAPALLLFAGPTGALVAAKLGVILLAALVAGYAIRRAAEGEGRGWLAAWTSAGAFAALVAMHGALRLAPPARGGAFAAVAAGAALLVAGAALARRGSLLAPGALAVGHGWIAVALANALSWEAAGAPVSWAFAGLSAGSTLASVAAAAAAARGSRVDLAHRVVALVAGLLSAVVVLHASGRTTVRAQAEPLALLLAVAMGVTLVAGSAWARGDAARILHGAMLLLVAAAGWSAAGGEDPSAPGWSAAAVARFAAAAAAFYGIAAARRDAWSLAASIAAASASALALSVHFAVAWPTRSVVAGAAGAALAVAATRLEGDRFGWMGVTVAACGRTLFWLAVAAESAAVLGALDLGNPALGRHVAAFAALAACAWALERVSPPARGLYRAAWRALAIGAYGLSGVWLGFHPWRDSAYYTLPVGALLVGAGVWASRRERHEEAGPLLWLGALLAAAPMLLHALDNRFVLGVSPIGYDAATLTVGLALALVGVLFQLRAPSIVGAVAFATDLFVVAFGKIEWEQIPLSIYVATVGGLLFAASWLLLYRRDDLLRLRDFLRTRHEAFQQWR